MRCTDVRQLLDELADGRLATRVRGDLEAHLESCADCRRAQAARDDLLLRVAALPRSVEPDRDLWDGIAARIEGGTVVRGRFSSPGSISLWTRPGLLAAAALALVVASSGLTALFLGSGGAAPQPTADSAAPAARSAVAATVAWEEFTSAEEEYERITGDLLEILEARRHELAPETILVLEESLEMIDEAIADARAALQRDPANAGLTNKLTGIYRSKTDFLRAMSRL